MPRACISSAKRILTGNSSLLGSCQLMFVLLLLLLLWQMFFVSTFDISTILWTPGACYRRGRSARDGKMFLTNDQLLCYCNNTQVYCPKITRGYSSDISNEVIHVLTGASHDRIIGLVALINSIQENTRAAVKYHIVTDEEGAVHLEKWLAGTELRSVDRDIVVFNASWIEGKVKVPDSARKQEFLDPITYARFFIPRLFPDYNGRLIYLDDDCIVQGDIGELYDTPIADGHVGAFSTMCQEIARHFHMHWDSYGFVLNYSNRHIRQLDIPTDSCTVNSGLFVIDVAKWKAKKITDQLLYWSALNTRETIYRRGADQSVFMVVFHGRYSLIDPFWHVRRLGYNEGRHYPEALLEKQAQLLHWNGHDKPWKNPRQYGAKLWMKYYIPDPLGLQTPSELNARQPSKVLKQLVDINGHVRTKKKKLQLLRRYT